MAQRPPFLHILMVVWGSLEIILFGGVIFGWASLVYIYKEEGYFSELCSLAVNVSGSNENNILLMFSDGVWDENFTAPSEYERGLAVENETGDLKFDVQSCKEQDNQFSLIFTIATVLTGIMCFANGFVYDHYGTRVCRSVAIVSFLLSMLFLIFASPARPQLLYPGAILLVYGGYLLLVTNLQLANLMPEYRSTIMTMYAGSYDCSSVIFLVYKSAYEHGVSVNTCFIIQACLFIIVIISTFITLPVHRIPWPLPEHYQIHLQICDICLNQDSKIKLSEHVVEEDNQDEYGKDRLHSKRDVCANNDVVADDVPISFTSRNEKKQGDNHLKTEIKSKPEISVALSSHGSHSSIPMNSSKPESRPFHQSVPNVVQFGGAVMDGSTHQENACKDNTKSTNSPESRSKHANLKRMIDRGQESAMRGRLRNHSESAKYDADMTESVDSFPFPNLDLHVNPILDRRVNIGSGEYMTAISHVPEIRPRANTTAACMAPASRHQNLHTEQQRDPLHIGSGEFMAAISHVPFEIRPRSKTMTASMMPSSRYRRRKASSHRNIHPLSRIQHDEEEEEITPLDSAQSTLRRKSLSVNDVGAQIHSPYKTPLGRLRKKLLSVSVTLSMVSDENKSQERLNKSCGGSHPMMHREADLPICSYPRDTLYKELEDDVEVIPTFTSVALSPLFLSLLFWMSCQRLRSWFFVAGFNPWITTLADGDQIKVSYYTSVFSALQFFGILTAPLGGRLMDCKPKHHYEEKTLERVHSSVPTFILNCTVSLLLSIGTALPILDIQYVTFALHTLHRSFLYGPNSAFVASAFPGEHFGKLLGVILTVSAIFGMLQYPLVLLIQGPLNYDPLWVNVGLIVLMLLTYAHPIYICFYLRQKRRLEMVKNDASLTTDPSEATSVQDHT